MDIAIIGAGLAGLACAGRLAAAGHRPSLFDKGRAPGGRMTTRRIATSAGEVQFDHGAQYFTARAADFKAEVAAWAAAGLAAPWPAAGPEAWVGTPAMNAPLRHLALPLAVTWSAEVKGIARAAPGWRLQGPGLPDRGFDAVLVAVPAEQAVPLLAPHAPGFAARAATVASAPCWALLVAFAERLAVPEDCLREAGPIGWAARNSAKPGRSGPENWVIQAGPAWSTVHLDYRPEQIPHMLLPAFSARIGAVLPDPLVVQAHRWRYARAGAEGSGALWDPALALGACGDWLLGPRVECAWLSGIRLAGLVA
jgi:predicted NAD/FAD-dependent oxidoreductase